MQGRKIEEKMFNKKFLIMILAVTCLFAGCGKTPETAAVVPEEKTEEVADEAAGGEQVAVSEQEEETPAIVNPLREVTKDELLAETGITFIDEAITLEPEYFVLTPADPSESKVAELRFMVGERELTYRAQKTDKTEAYDTTGLYYEWDMEKDVKVVNSDAKYMKCAEASGMYWIDIENKINYSISCVGDMDESQLIGCASILFNPPDPEDPGIAPAYDYEGSYTDPDDNNVVFTRKEDGTYEIEIRIFRLMSTIGTANDVDGGAEFVVKDQDANDMCGVFYKNPDDTYTLLFTQSTWLYIKDGDAYEGFKRD